MKPLCAAVLLVLVSLTPVWSAQRSIAFYLDGAVVEETVAASSGGIATVQLPAAMQPGSLRIVPTHGSVIDRVEVVSAGSAKDHADESARLSNRKELLYDRLKALETREEIFRAAARSQSGKAPRKTKSNPEPLAAIRQGTDYALAQLEDVYRQQRNVRKELATVEARLAAMDKGVRPQGLIARIFFAGKGKSGTLSYVRTDLAWTPRYDFRLDDAGSVRIAIRPHLPKTQPGFLRSVILARLTDSLPGTYAPGDVVPKEPFRLRAERAVYRGGPGSSLTFSLTNTGTFHLPPGEAACYWQGEYMGTVAFPGCEPGQSREVSIGIPARAAESASP